MGIIVSSEYEMDFDILDDNYKEGLMGLLDRIKSQLSDYIIDFAQGNVTDLQDGSYLLEAYMGLNPKRFPEFHKSYNESDKSMKIKIGGQVIDELTLENPYYVSLSAFWLDNRVIISIEDSMSWPYDANENKWGAPSKVNIQAIVFMKMMLAKVGASFAKFGPLNEDSGNYDYYLFIYGDTVNVLFSIMETQFTDQFMTKVLKKYKDYPDFEIEIKEKMRDYEMKEVLDEIKGKVANLVQPASTIVSIQFAKAMGEKGTKENFDSIAKDLVKTFIG